MKFRISILSLLMVMACSLTAMPKGKNGAKRDAWFKEMQQVKHDYLTQELGLTREQQSRFFPLYDAMERDRKQLFDQTRQLEKAVEDKGEKATDLEIEKATEAMFEMPSREGAINKAYYLKFKNVLNRKQLFKLNKAERDFRRTMVRQHHKMRHNKQKN